MHRLRLSLVIRGICSSLRSWPTIKHWLTGPEYGDRLVRSELEQRQLLRDFKDVWGQYFTEFAGIAVVKPAALEHGSSVFGAWTMVWIRRAATGGLLLVMVVALCTGSFTCLT